MQPRHARETSHAATTSSTAAHRLKLALARRLAAPAAAAEINGLAVGLRQEAAGTWGAQQVQLRAAPNRPRSG